MKRVGFAVIVVALAGILIFFESTPHGASIRDGLSGWLAVGALPAQPETITVVEMPAAGGSIRALDAALALRAILRGQPKAIVFLDPIEPGETEALFLSKLTDAKGACRPDGKRQARPSATSRHFESAADVSGAHGDASRGSSGGRNEGNAGRHIVDRREAK